VEQIACVKHSGSPIDDEEGSEWGVGDIDAEAEGAPGSACKIPPAGRYPVVVQRPPEGVMAGVLSMYLVPLAIGAVAIVLVFGLVNMMRGGSPNTSQRLMRLRVLLQFVAIVVIMITIWAMQK
jgi:hypothetical protein